MENRIELFVAKLFAQFERRQILRDEIAAVAAQIFKITGTKIIDHREARFRKFFLQREREVGADEAGAAGNEKAEGRIRSSHGGNYSAANQICLELAKAME